MNIIEEFFIKFNTDAKQARADIDQLDKKIVELASKGKNRSEQEVKELKELRALRTQHLQDLKDTTSQTDKLDVSFGKLASAGASALLAFAGIGKIYGAVKDAADYNFELFKTAKLTGTNVRELNLWDKAVQQAGGNAGEFLGYITQLNQQYAALGVNDRIKYVTRDFLALAKAWEGLTDAQRQQRGVQLGLTPGEILLLDQGYEGVKKILAEQAKFNNETAETAKLGMEVRQVWTNIGSEFTSAFTDSLPLLKQFGEILLKIADLTRVVMAGWAVIADSVSFVYHLWEPAKRANDVKSLLADREEAQQAFSNLFGNTGATPTPAPGAPGGAPSAQSSAVLPLISQYESGNRNVPNASGPGGSPASTASGYYQILNGTWRQFAPQAGVNLSQYPTAMSAPFDVQTKVASLIYQQQGLAPWASDSRLLAAVAAGQVAQTNQSPLNSTTSSSNSLSVGSVTINTQATDASGIAQSFHGEMQKQYSQTINSYDDGVAY